MEIDGNIIVDLENYFNSKIITTKEQQQECRERFEFCGMRNQEWHMYDGNSLPGSGEVVVFKDVVFQFPNKDERHCDAISCEGDIIEVQKDMYQRIYLFGAAFDECGGEEVFAIHYDSGKVEEKKIFMKEWYYLAANTKWDNPNSDIINSCVPVITAAHLSDSTKRCIYCVSIDVSQENKVIAVELPFNPDIYIFGITLGKK